MARRKDPIIPDAIVDQLLAGADPKTIFDPNGLIAEAAKLLEDPDQRQPLTLRLRRIRRQQPIQLLAPGSHARIGLVLALVAEG